MLVHVLAEVGGQRAEYMELNEASNERVG